MKRREKETFVVCREGSSLSSSQSRCFPSLFNESSLSFSFFLFPSLFRLHMNNDEEKSVRNECRLFGCIFCHFAPFRSSIRKDLTRGSSLSPSQSFLLLLPYSLCFFHVPIHPSWEERRDQHCISCTSLTCNVRSKYQSQSQRRRSL